MAEEKRVYAYYDGSNFYHLLKSNYYITKVYFVKITNKLINSNEKLIKIKYFNSPVSQQEDPKNYANQLKFFQKLKGSQIIELSLGRLVKRALNKVNVECSECGYQKAEFLNCPKCGKKINITETYKNTEKGVDVQLAISLLLDALNDKYDIALLFSGDADFCPAIKYIINNLKKEIIFCYFPDTKTNELIQTCSDKRLITKEIIEKSQINR